MSSIRVYIAAPIFNEHQLSVVHFIETLLEAHNFEYFSPYKNSQGIWKGRKPSECSPQERAQVIQDNVNGLHWCDILLAWVGGNEEGYTDTGVVWEMGYAAALAGAPAAYEHEPRQPIVMAYISPNDRRQSLNLMLAATVDLVVVGNVELDQAIYDLSVGKEAWKEFSPKNLPGREPVV